jgi:hypothetical protein
MEYYSALKKRNSDTCYNMNAEDNLLIELSQSQKGKDQIPLT